MAKPKRYVLTIEFDPDSDLVEFISEELIEDEPTVFVDDLDISDYWDEESMKLIEEMYDVGVT
jgi:hypothetical protein